MRKYSEKMLVSFLTADAGRTGEEDEGGLPPPPPPTPAWSSWSSGRFGALRCFKKTQRGRDLRDRRSIRRPGLDAFVDLQRAWYRPHLTAPGQRWFLKSKDFMYIMDFFLREEKKKKKDCDWIPLLHKVLYPRRTFRFFFCLFVCFFPQLELRSECQDDVNESKRKKIFINLPLLKTWLWLWIKISI